MNICPRCNEPTYTLDDAKYHRDCAEEEIDSLTAELAICRDAVKKHQQDLFDENEKVVKLRGELAANAAMLARQTDLAREAEIQLAEATKAVEGRDKTLVASGQSIQYLERELEQANAKLEKVRMGAGDVLERIERTNMEINGLHVVELSGFRYVRSECIEGVQTLLMEADELARILTEPEGGPK